MIEQGIKNEDILLFIDTDSIGCLQSCITVFSNAPNRDMNDGIWYLQDDVVICGDFKELTERYDKGLVCGYCYDLDLKKNVVGEVTPRDYWYSFPCIRIPNKIARDFVDWFYTDAVNNREYSIWIKSKKYDDSMFDIYMKDYYPDYVGLNLKPNLVDHIDYLIGGSIINSTRDQKETHAVYFECSQLVDKLAKKLQKSVDD